MNQADRQRIRQAVDARRRELIADQSWSHHGRTDLLDLPLVLALARLSEDEREVWVDRNVIGRTLESIGRGMRCKRNPKGLSRERVRQIERDGTNRLRAILGDQKLDEWKEAA